MALWDQVPFTGPTTNFQSTDGGTGEIRFTARVWEFWPSPSSEGIYMHKGWVSPDSIWGKADVRFRLVNFIDIETDDEHAAPTGGGLNDRWLRENHTTLTQDPRHISDRSVLKVIIMHRIAPPDAPEIGRALIGLSCLGISWSQSDRFAVLAHEIGHLITGSQVHNNLPNNVLNDPGPGTDITPEQAERARTWARSFADFWQRL
jgi:hypothetical protein